MVPRLRQRVGRTERRDAGPDRVWIYAAALGLALAALATLQFRWTGEVSRQEHERLARVTAAAMQRFALELDRELSEAAVQFLGAGVDDLPEAWRRWQDGAHRPELVAEILVDDPVGGLRRLDPARSALVPADPPAELPRLHGDAARRGSPPWPRFVASRAAAWIVLPAAPRALHRELTGEPAAPGSTLVLRLDLAALRDTVLPAIARDAFGPELGLEQDLWVTTGADDGVVWTSRPGPAAAAPADAPRLALGMLGGLDELHARTRHLALGAALPRRSEPGWDGPRRRADGPLQPRFARRGAPLDAPWLLVAQHPAGSLDRAVARLRARNLAVSFAVLGLLGASGALLLLAARRAQDTARRQTEWVAGLTHELHTPLAALSAAGENLADGVIQTPEKVREYGELIRREGRRLQNLVAQALALARLDGLQRGERHDAVAVPLAPLVERAAADRELERRQRGATFAIELSPDLPAAWVEPAALERVLGNLLDNALKHGGRRVWLLGRREPAHPTGATPRLSLTVADDGPGLADGERQAVFEPYFRGAAARASGAAGAGLGLHLVKRLVDEMGGEIAVLPRGAADLPAAATGAAFRISLPVAPDASGSAP